MKRLWTLLSAAAMLAAVGAIVSCDIDTRAGGPGFSPNINGQSIDFGQAAKGLTQGWNAMTLSQKDEDAIGQSVAISITSQYPLVQNPNLQRYVNLVGLTVASVSPNPGGNWIFGVVESPEINAFSGPNGYVFITHAAFNAMHDEAELAGVLGHEIAHVCNHDGLNQIKLNEGKGAAADFANSAGGQIAQFGALADVGVDAITKTGYSQPQEFKADEQGTRFMSAAGYNPQSYLNLLERMQGMVASGGGVMSTHPGMSDRIKHVQKNSRRSPPPARHPRRPLRKFPGERKLTPFLFSVLRFEF